jgi:DNA invertase Pin-like site-specific DNA recombinase
MGVLAEFERALVSERVAAGIKRSRADYAAGRIGKDKHTRSGKDLPAGRPRRIFRRDEAARLRELGWSWRAMAKHLGVSASTLRGALRLWASASSSIRC